MRLTVHEEEDVDLYITHSKSAEIRMAIINERLLLAIVNVDGEFVEFVTDKEITVVVEESEEE